MVKRIELGTSYIVPKGLLSFYTTLLFYIFEDKRVEPYVYFDKHTFYTMCRKDWEWGETALQNILDSLILTDELGNPHEYEIVCTYIRRIREIKNLLTKRAVERPIYAYVQV